VTYSPLQLDNADIINEVLSQLDDAREMICTKADTNILWIQENFNVPDETYKDVLNLAGTWDAAVELIQFTPSDVEKQISSNNEPTLTRTESWRESGIMEDDAGQQPQENGQISKVYEKLINDGYAGSKKIIEGSQKTLLNSINRAVSYRLVILDNLFISKGSEARTRMLQEWTNYFSDNLHVPVLSLKELHSKYKFGSKDFIKMTVFIFLTGLIFYSVFHFDNEIISFLSQEGLFRKILAAVSVFCFVPFFAYLYSSATKLFFKLIKLD